MRGVKLEGVDKKFAEQANLYVQAEIRPNSRFNLALYNLFNTKNGKYRTSRIRAIGQAPHLLDTPLVDFSTKEIQKFLVTKGFLNARVTNEIKIKKKKAYITFKAASGPLFYIHSFSYTVADSAVKALYEQSRNSFSHISSNMRYDVDSLRFESQQIYNLLRRNGYYDYLQQYVRYVVDTGLVSNEVNVKLFLENPPNRTSHQLYRLGDTYLTVRTSEGKIDTNVVDSAFLQSQYHYSDYSGRFKPKPVIRYVFLKKGDLFNVERQDITYNRLYELNVFKNIKIDFEKAKDDSLTLEAKIEAIPLKRMSNRVEGEYTFSTGRSGFNVGNTYTNRNLFRGAEQLDVKFRYGVLFDSKLRRGIFNRDFQAGITLSFPRLITPFGTPDIGKNGVPHTTFSTSFQAFDQPGAFTNRQFINSIVYNWVETRYRLHSFTPLNVEYRTGHLTPSVRQTLEEQGNLLYIKTNDRSFVNVGSLYNFTLNAVRLNNYENFSYFRGALDVGGNTLGLLATAFQLHKNQGNRTFLGLPYLQYAKTELDYRLYRYLGGERQLVARINPGFAYPYGNIRELPFERNFYAGGSTGIRAWQARTLGPGNYNRSVITDVKQRENLTYLDQFGEIKLEGNLEYRFKMLNSFFGAKLKGAAFTDFGNVWRLRENQGMPGGEFQFDRFFKQIAIGSGFGLRFDVQYFVFRFDVGVKVKDPQFGDSDQWVIKHLFRNAEFKENYSISNGDTYRFVQYNFGIGMPF